MNSCIVTFLNRWSGQRGAPMAPPPPSRPKEITTTQFQIKRTTCEQTCQDKVAKAFVWDEVDDLI
jgi:hypothetical protein